MGNFATKADSYDHKVCLQIFFDFFSDFCFQSKLQKHRYIQIVTRQKKAKQSFHLTD